MKITISLPDPLASAADALAGRLGVSRDDLHATALAEFLARHAAGEVTARLGRLYADEPGALDPAFRRAQGRSPRSDRR